jgi:hypothetical protein
VTIGSRASIHVTPWPLWQGLIVVVVVPTYVTPSQRERGTGIGRRVIFNYAVSPPTRWTGLCGAPTIAPYRPRQQLVRTCQSPHLRHDSPPAVPRHAPSGTASHTVPRPKGPVYRLRGRWPFVYVMPQDVAVYRHAGRSSLTSWGTFRAARSVLVRDVLVVTALASLARESRELVHDVSHHGQTSAGCAHHCSVSS